MGYTISIACVVFLFFVFYGLEEIFKYWEEAEKYVLTTVLLGSRRGEFCRCAKIYTTSFILTREFEELAPPQHPDRERLSEEPLLEEELEVPGVIDGVYNEGRPRIGRHGQPQDKEEGERASEAERLVSHVRWWPVELAQR